MVRSGPDPGPISNHASHQYHDLLPLPYTEEALLHVAGRIRRYFTDLEFIPVKSQLLASSNLELLGGRYCSVQSVPAAQLRLSGADKNSLQTLYQSEYRRDVFGQLPILENGDVPVAVNVKGITVRIWVEKGLLFALTEAVQLDPIAPVE